MKVELTDKVALVTGSAHRVGKAIALELARCGVHILVHYHSSPEDVVKETVRDIKSLGADAFPVQANLSTPEGVDKVFEAIKEHFGRLHILVNSASNFQRRRLMDVTLDEWNETLAINLTAPFLCTQRAVPLMLANDPPEGCIINIGDRGSLEPWPDYAHHGISKAGLLALSQVSAASLGPHIRVNTIIPGAVLKPEGVPQERWEQNALSDPLQRPGTAEDVARAVVYLCQEDFITGAVLRVDGGAHLTTS
ncbi:MAG: SDR family oxidoreductase [Chloroflexota bacterium]|nr:MAG: short-chain dehydrogenase [Chloroflexota bacterium]